MRLTMGEGGLESSAKHLDWMSWCWGMAPIRGPPVGPPGECTAEVGGHRRFDNGFLDIDPGAAPLPVAVSVICYK